MEKIRKSDMTTRTKINTSWGSDRQLNLFLFEWGVFGASFFPSMVTKADQGWEIWSTEVRICVFIPFYFCIWTANSKTKNFLKSFLYIIGKLTKKPLEWVYICWTKSEQNPRYSLPKLSLLQPEKYENFSKVFTLKAFSEEPGGNKGFLYIIFC
jgi:hypothetical protein